jgi:hypothetical protein
MVFHRKPENKSIYSRQGSDLCWLSDIAQRVGKRIKELL